MSIFYRFSNSVADVIWQVSFSWSGWKFQIKYIKFVTGLVKVNSCVNLCSVNKWVLRFQGPFNITGHIEPGCQLREMSDMDESTLFEPRPRTHWNLWTLVHKSRVLTSGSHSPTFSDMATRSIIYEILNKWKAMSNKVWFIFT